MVKIKIHPQDEKNNTFLKLVCKQKRIFLSDVDPAHAPAHLYLLWHPTTLRCGSQSSPPGVTFSFPQYSEREEYYCLHSLTLDPIK